MSTFKDFLVWYNNLDVVPFLEAVEKMSQFWQERKIDMFKDDDGAGVKFAQGRLIVLANSYSGAKGIWEFHCFFALSLYVCLM